MRSSILVPSRLGAALALVLGGVGTTVLTSAAPASAGGQCSVSNGHSVSPGQYVEAWDTEYCPPHPLLNLKVTISANGVVVASGNGEVTYTCQGSTERQYYVTYSDGPGDPKFEAACG